MLGEGKNVKYFSRAMAHDRVIFSAVKVVFRWVSSLPLRALKVEAELRFWTPVSQVTVCVISAHRPRHFKKVKYPLDNPNTYLFQSGFSSKFKSLNVTCNL